MISWLQKFHRDLPPTRVFAFGTSEATATVPGPTIEAVQGTATYITWENHLPSHHILPFDPTIPIADPKNGGVPTVVHLHGGIHPPASDGNSQAWFTSSFRSKGPAFVAPTSFYPNVQEPGNLWYGFKIFPSKWVESLVKVTLNHACYESNVSYVFFF